MKSVRGVLVVALVFGSVPTVVVAQPDCTLTVSQVSSSEVPQNCGSGTPGSSTKTWRGICESDCDVYYDQWTPVTLVGMCPVTTYQCYDPGHLGCSWQWGSSGYQDSYQLDWQAEGWDGLYNSQCACDRGARKTASYSCYSCGHPCWEPVVVSLRDEVYSLTSAEGGVDFDLNADGVKDEISWTGRRSDEAWLVLDRNGNGLVDDGRELFSHVSPQPEPPPGELPHGFRALAVFDDPLNGGNADGSISAEDAVYRYLRLWRDRNHDGVSQRRELHPLRRVGLRRISLSYGEEGAYQDRFGNRFTFSTTASFRHGRQSTIWVVYLVGENGALP